MNSKELSEAILIVFKKLGKWILISFLIFGVVIVIFQVFDKVSYYYANRPQVVSTIKGIALGEKESDFLFRNAGFELNIFREGVPDNVTDYSNSKLSLYVTLKDSKVSTVLYDCINPNDRTSFNGIQCGNSGDLILNKYSSDVLIFCLTDKSDKLYSKYRIYDVSKFGIRHHVFSNSVEGFQMFDVKSFEEERDAKKWTVCV